MNYPLLSLNVNAPDVFLYRPNLEQRDVRRWPFALLATTREDAENALAPFGNILTGIIVTFGSEYSWIQCAPLLFHFTVPSELTAQLGALLHSHLMLLDNCQQATYRNNEQKLELARSQEECNRNKLEFSQVKESLIEELTKRRRAQEALHESEYRWKFAIEGSGDGVWDWNIQSGEAQYTKRWKEMLGYSEDCIHPANEEWVQRIHPDDKSYVSGAMQAYLNGNTATYVVQYRLRCKDESYKWILGRGTVVNRSEDGTPLRMIGTHTDITEMKQAKDNLEENRRFLADIIEYSGMIIAVKEVDGRYVTVNRKWEEVTGVSRDEAIGKTDHELFPHTSGMQFRDNDLEVLSSGTCIEREEELEDSQKKRRYAISIKFPLKSKDGSIRGLCVMSTDITDRKEHEKELLKIEKLESLGILAGGIAHDFNNIITGIMGNISFAQMFIDANHKSYKPLLEAEKASVRATELAHQLLTFARGGEPIKKVISLHHLLNESISLVLHGSNVKGKVDIIQSIHAIDADEGQISQVFHNIIINATQAMPGGGTLTVSAQNVILADCNTLTLPGGTYVLLKFTDQGCGIPDDDLKRIFDPYFTTKLTGNGLGLASAYSIVCRHGGHIGVKSIKGTGTTFSIHLPSIGHEQKDSQTETSMLTTGEHSGGSILVMDDEEMIRDMTSEMLEFLGYSVTTCVNGAEAVQLFKAARESGESFSMVIMDLTIPGGMGGKETAEQILAIDHKACLIVSSGYSNDPIISDFSKYGFAGAVAKPYKMTEFGQLLSSLLLTRNTESLNSVNPS
ncbi:MAG: PAS domain-containing protein, partial [Desulfuromonadales bacterium]